MSIIILKDIIDKVNSDSSKHEILKEEFEKKSKYIDVLVKKIDTKCKNNKTVSKDVLECIEELNRDKISKMESDKSIFSDYIFSYFNACIAIRNDMVIKKNTILFYAYMFNLVHFLELVIKALVFFDVDGFTDIKQGHKILELYKNSKNGIINLGLDKKYYNKLIELLEKLQCAVNKPDIAMCFKYPVDKDFFTPIITSSMKDIEFKEILKLIEEHKILILIVIDIYILSRISNYKEIMICINNLIRALQELSKNL
ncbi:MAG: hypothetical protein IJE59_00185 [Clostridia bacterium]|nr:hypothetical protein [Clostridia bacterium]